MGNFLKVHTFIFESQDVQLRKLTRCTLAVNEMFTITESGVCVLSHVWLFATPGMVALQALLSMGFSRQECWSGLLFPSPGDLPDPGTEPTFPESPPLAGRFFTTSATREALDTLNLFIFHIKCTVLQQNIHLLINIYCSGWSESLRKDGKGRRGEFAFFFFSTSMFVLKDPDEYRSEAKEFKVWNM